MQIWRRVKSPRHGSLVARPCPREEGSMDRDLFAGMTRAIPLRVSRRWITLGTLVAGGRSLLEGVPGDARPRRKKKKTKHKNDKRQSSNQTTPTPQPTCAGTCSGAEVCRDGRCHCPEGARYLTICVPQDGIWCPADPVQDPLVCCPQERIYAVCPLVGGTLPPSLECTAPEAEAPSVCCPAARVCGQRCCEFGECIDGQCASHPPQYARLKRPG
jgi:hypothetical protein